MGERTVRVSNPDRVYFPATGATKLDLVDYYLVGRAGHRQRPPGAAVHDAPLPDRGGRREGPPEAGAGRRAAVARDGPRALPPLRPARRRAVRDRARRRSSGRCRCRRSSSIRGTRGGPTSSSPTSGGSTSTRCPTARSTTVRRVADVVHEVLDELGAVGWPKTSGGKGLHVYVRIEPAHGFTDVRRAALAFAREVERRAPDDVTTTWWRKDRDPGQALRRLQPERPRPHDGGGVLGAGRARRARCRRRSPGTRSTTSSRTTARWRPCRPASRELGDLHAGIDDAVFAIDDAARVGRPRRTRRCRRRRRPDEDT